MTTKIRVWWPIVAKFHLNHRRKIQTAFKFHRRHED